MKKAMMTVGLVSLLVLALGLDEQKWPNLEGSGWIRPERANGIYVQKSDSLYERRQGQDMYRLVYLPEASKWAWQLNGINMAIKDGPSPIGVYDGLMGKFDEPTISKHN